MEDAHDSKLKFAKGLVDIALAEFRWEKLSYLIFGWISILALFAFATITVLSGMLSLQNTIGSVGASLISAFTSFRITHFFNKITEIVINVINVVESNNE